MFSNLSTSPVKTRQMGLVHFCKCVMNILFLKGIENVNMYIITSCMEASKKQLRTSLETMWIGSPEKKKKIVYSNIIKDGKENYSYFLWNDAFPILIVLWPCLFQRLTSCLPTCKNMGGEKASKFCWNGGCHIWISQQPKQEEITELSPRI